MHISVSMSSRLVRAGVYLVVVFPLCLLKRRLRLAQFPLDFPEATTRAFPAKKNGSIRAHVGTHDLGFMIYTSILLT